MSEAKRELWRAISAFDKVAVVAALGAVPANFQTELDDEQLRQIAACSTVPYWISADGNLLWSEDYQMPGAQPISAAEALDRFGLEGTEEAREKGSWDARWRVQQLS